MRNFERLQKLLYLIMVILGVYIIYKGGGILLSGPAVRHALDTGSIQQILEDTAMRTYAPGYTAAVEDYKSPAWMSYFMKQTVPVYSYVSERARLERKMQEQESENMKQEQDSENRTEPELVSESGAESQTEATLEKQTEAETEAKSDAEPEPIAEVAALMDSELLLRSQIQDFTYMLNNFYTVDGGTSADEELLNAKTLLETDLHIEQNPDVPQILIYHTHAQEAFADSEEGAVEESIVGMGEILAQHLREYGYNVIHDTGVYDLVDGVLDRSAAYDHARRAVQQILEENPTVEVIIDLHRDGVEGKKFVTEIDGKPCSMIMFFNGISRNSNDEPLSWLENPYIQENLAFSLQLQLKARAWYPGFTRNIYLKAERFNLHLRPRSLLIEAGTQLNTVEEESNAMKPLAKLLVQVLTGT